MIGFVEFIEKIEFIGDGGNNPPPGQVAWDLNTPWDGITFWS